MSEEATAGLVWGPPTASVGLSAFFLSWSMKQVAQLEVIPRFTVVKGTQIYLYYSLGQY